MLALWVESASPCRIGATSWEMNPDRPWVGSCSAVTSVILPPVIVIWTWTRPKGSGTTDPVKVPLPFLATFVGAGVAPGARDAWATGVEVAPAGPLPVEVGSVEAPGANAVGAVAPRAEALSAGVLKLNSKARAMAVVTMAATARFGIMVLRIRTRSVRNGCGGAGCRAAGVRRGPPPSLA